MSKLHLRSQATGLLMKILLALLLVVALTGCGPNVRTDAVPPPPEVDCILQPTPEVPPKPKNWVLEGAEWAAGVLGILDLERERRHLEHKCLNDLKEKGVIR